MKKQIFLLSAALLFAGHAVADVSNCCNTTTNNSNCSKNCCVPEHGKTRRDVTPHFQAASPELASFFNSDALSNLNKDDKHGIFEVTVFGGKSTKGSQAASYFLPYGNSQLTFDGSIQNPRAFARTVGESVVQTSAKTAPATSVQIGWNYDNSADTLLSDPATYAFDSNTDDSKILPWNFGITFAALFEPLGAQSASVTNDANVIGSGLITAPTFNSTISPTYRYSHIGAGVALRYHFSDDKCGWFGALTTAVQHVRSRICLNENEVAPKQQLNSTTFTQQNPNTTGLLLAPNNDIMGIYGNASLVQVAPASTEGFNLFAVAAGEFTETATNGSIYEAYLQTPGFPSDAANAAVPAPANVTEAFNQNAWNYGKIGCLQKITRLADIELSLGYQWHCGDCADTNWYVGVVIPTGNKPCATYVAPAVVGNGQHAGIMIGSQTDLMMCDEDDYKVWYRLDANCRYLFRNTQKCSFDLLGNEWSRYMMVWASEDDYTAAVTAANTLKNAPFANGSAVTGTPQQGFAQRNYTPGINVFTSDFYVKPQYQGRINNAVYFEGEHFRAELGWNTFARQKDCVEMACEWKNTPAFADSSYVAGLGLNNSRTIYNDAQTMCYNAVDSLLKVGDSATAPTGLVTLATNLLAPTNYDEFAISADQINYDSMSTSAAITNTPYLTLGYAFESDYKPVVAVGASYEFTANNAALNQWCVWGKFEIGF